MRVVTRRTGLSAELLRVWERRHGVVTPARTRTGRRLYSDAQIERLRLLHQLTLAGRSIGLVAALSTPALAALARQDAEAERAATRVAMPNVAESARFVEEALDAISRFDGAALAVGLRRAVLTLPAAAFLDDVVTPVLERVGTRAEDGTLRPVHARLAATIVRRELDRVMESASTPGAAPGVVLATLPGHEHELGAMLAGAAAAGAGWSVTYLGTGVPVEDLAAAARATRARAVGLSLVFPPNDRAVADELRRLRSLLPKSVTLLAGGAAAVGYQAALERIGAVQVRDLGDWRERLETMRRAIRR